MNARFSLQPAIGIGPLDQNGRSLDARFLAVLYLNYFNLAPVPAAPARIHAQQHCSPVLAFSSARTGMDFNIGIIAIHLTGQHRPNLLVANLFAQLGNGAFRLRDDLVITLGFTHFYQFKIIRHCGLQTQNAIDLVIKVLAFAHDFLRLRCIIPKVGIFDQCVQFCKAVAGIIPVKDASLAG